MSTLLAIIDVQHDFLPGGSLGVNDGNMVIPVINQIRNQFNLPTVFSKDYHPADHISFQVNNPGSTLYKNHTVKTREELTMWPVHCVQNTHGSEIHPDLIRTESDLIVHKGTDTNKTLISSQFPAISGLVNKPSISKNPYLCAVFPLTRRAL
jgi:nicotinamidase/pyrazinamidase